MNYQKTLSIERSLTRSAMSSYLKKVPIVNPFKIVMRT